MVIWLQHGAYLKGVRGQAGPSRLVGRLRWEEVMAAGKKVLAEEVR